MFLLATDTEMGLLHNPTTCMMSEDEANTSGQDSIPDATEHRHSLHEVIGDALEVFSRHLRAHN
jgi:hypothetical protein